MSHVTEVHGSGKWDGINVRAGNAVQQQAFLAVPSERRWANSASDRDSSGAEAEGGHTDGLGVYRHRRCNRHYFSRAGAFLRSVWQEGPYEKFDERKKKGACVS
jgi:hypothetical protein